VVLEPIDSQNFIKERLFISKEVQTTTIRETGHFQVP